MPGVDFDRVRLLVSLERVLDHLRWRPWFLEPAGRRGPCPLHLSSSKRPRSFAVRGNAWYCHKCQKGGGAIELWVEIKGLPLYEAAIDLCRTLGVPVPWGSVPASLPRRIRNPDLARPEKRRRGGSGGSAPGVVGERWVCTGCQVEQITPAAACYCGFCGLARLRLDGPDATPPAVTQSSATGGTSNGTPKDQ